LHDHPIRLTVDDDLRRSRLTVFFRPLLALPHLVWISLWAGAATVAAIANSLVVLLTGRSARSLHRFLAAYTGYFTHVSAFLFLVANPFPGFTGGLAYPVEAAIPPPKRQSRWITVFRPVLVLPALFLSALFLLLLAGVGLLGWLAALATGRMPQRLRDQGAICVLYLAQANAYGLVLRDAYPRPTRQLAGPPPEAVEEAAAT
jgi:hypothetical protein